MSVPSDIDWLETQAGSNPSRVALIRDGDALSYGKLNQMAKAVVDESGGRRFRQGSVVRLPARPWPAFVADMFAVLRAGAVLWPSSHGDYGAVEHEQLLPYRPLGPVAVIETSGSAGEPKRVVITTENVDAAVAASASILGNDASDTWLLCLPLHHIAGLSVVWRSFAVGGAVVLTDGFDPQAIAVLFHSGTVTMASLVPTMLFRLLEYDPGPFRGLKAVLVGGGPASSALMERALEAGLPVLATYGMSETCSQVATVTPGEERLALGTVGRPLPGIELRIVRSDGSEADLGEIGEIVVDGSVVFAGYLGEAPLISPHRTGDLGYVDGAGRLVVAGRADNILISGGLMVSPEEVETMLSGHPAVVEAAVFGVPDAEWGEMVVAAFVGSEAVDGDDLAGYLREQLAAHKVPKVFLPVTGLPHLPDGKLDRPALASLAPPSS